MTINGNGHSISSTSQTLKLNVKNDIILIFKNITFKNDKIELNCENSNMKLTFADCKFKENNVKNEITIVEDISSEYYKAGNISETVEKLAKEIVGNSTDLEAAKKLAIWVGQNIMHETAPGFYQSPDVTLNRTLGNCCSQTLLFLQMCEAVGLNNSHKLYFIHVGTSIFHQRHFFAMIDDIFVDVDARPKNPWGNAKTYNDTFFKITEYPYLPLVRNY